MLLRLREVLRNDELGLVREWLADANFVDGRLSAGTVARRVKNNEELDARATELERLNNLVMNRLIHHPVYRGGALPLHVASPYYARYQPGMAYGNHLDDPIMGADGLRYRSDIAITIFLNAPEDYGGGELVIQTAFGSQPVKLAAGEGVLYPAGSIHQVNPVTRGERLVAVTWAQSLVRDPARRELLYELGQAREKLLQSAPDAAETAQVNTAYLNLIRMWSEI
ncbi:MAG: Fe2+-dependent dioxygenase [Betaproteobacteria bacterium]|nr:Fe2+-dependent dioxygenase [Betaproteobacteria bacterium]